MISSDGTSGVFHFGPGPRSQRYLAQAGPWARFVAILSLFCIVLLVLFLISQIAQFDDMIVARRELPGRVGSIRRLEMVRNLMIAVGASLLVFIWPAVCLIRFASVKGALKREDAPGFETALRQGRNALIGFGVASVLLIVSFLGSLIAANLVDINS